MKRPKYGWWDLTFRWYIGFGAVGAQVALVVGDMAFGAALIGIVCGLVACLKVDRLRQDLKERKDTHVG